MAFFTNLSTRPARAYSTRAKPQIYGSDVLIEEETLPKYQAQNYHPVRINEVMDRKYQVISKIGFGRSSTVWLAQDITRWRWLGNRYVTLKILTKEFSDRNAKNMELKASKCTRSADPGHEGLKYLRVVRESFEVGSPESPHLALVYEPMRESLATLQQRRTDSKLPSFFLKILIKFLLQGLDYLHTKCHIIHTDLKPENIMISVEKNSVLDDLAAEERDSPSPYKESGGRYIYLRRNFGDLKGPPGIPKIGDLGLAVWGHEKNYNHPIQPDLFQSSEVILRAGWSYSADIWNLGVMMWDLLENKPLFCAQDSAARYNPQAHLCEMVTMLGPPPKELLERGEKTSSYFDTNYHILSEHTMPDGGLALEDTTASLDENEKEQCYDNIRISRNAWDTNLVKANPKYISVNWEASGGGAFAVIPINEKGRLPEQLPLFRGHTAVVLDTDWSPFNDSLVASGSDDGKAFLYKVPEDFTLRTEEGEAVKDVAPVQKLSGHSRKVGHVLFNPAAENVLATSSGDYTIKLWDIEAGSPRLTLKHMDIVQSLSWSANGSLMVTTSRDKKLRVWDVRQEKPAHVVPGHQGAKNSRVTWMGEHDRVATTGFSKMSDRQLGLWDIRDPKEPVGGFQMLDAISGVCMPFWDDGTQCLYLAGKGDGNIRYFEYENDKFEFLSEYKSGDPQRGVAFLPKRGVNTHENEVMRAFKTVNDSYIEPISFIVPRRAEVFQDDIFPPVVGSKPAMSAGQWFDGKNGLPPKIDLASIYAGDEPAEVAVDYKPAAQHSPPTPSPTKKAPETVSELAAPASSMRGPPPSMNQQTSSIKDLASKFTDDKEDDESEGDSSSFEEIAKPIDRSERHAPAAAPIENSEPAAISRGLGDPLSPVDKPDDFVQASQVAASQDTPTLIKKERAPPSKSTEEPLSSKSTQEPLSSKSTQEPLANTKSRPHAGSVSDQPIQRSLAEIKSLLEQQTMTMSAQSQEIGKLTAEVDRLRTKLGE